MSIETIITAAIVILGIIAGGTYLAILKSTLKDLRNFLDVVIKALEDDTITKKEWQKIIQAGKKILTNFGSKKKRKEALKDVEK